ncbi:Uncharacterized protein APZ42_024612 [Daphnia magna]|uniref:Uncharacterized protein n=1 Tax=Daphnia magna TaxID=35525 RepID=A0A164TWC9_9CRUS|nr:Uncharacterized protein APZ42_024612 [Daphnia magna]
MRFVVVATTKKNEEYPTRLFWLTKAKALQSKAKQMKEANLFCTFRAAVTNKSFPIADAVIRLEAEDCQWPMPVRRSLSRSMYVLFLLKLKEKNSVFISATENSDIYIFSFHFTCIPDVWVRLSPSSDQAENPSLASALA